jgi:hypothetical protein
MSNNGDNKKPGKPPERDDKPTDNKRDSDKTKDGHSLDWLVEAANFEPKPQPPKKTDDWMADGGKIV